MIFLRVLPKIILWPHYSGAPGARGPRFIEPPETPVATPLGVASIQLCGDALPHTDSYKILGHSSLADDVNVTKQTRAVYARANNSQIFICFIKHQTAAVQSILYSDIWLLCSFGAPSFSSPTVNLTLHITILSDNCYKNRDGVGLMHHNFLCLIMYLHSLPIFVSLCIHCVAQSEGLRMFSYKLHCVPMCIPFHHFSVSSVTCCFNFFFCVTEFSVSLFYFYFMGFVPITEMCIDKQIDK